jgi:REP element-mobilizing transposase RayT
MLYREQPAIVVHRLQYSWTGWTAGEPLDATTIGEVLQATPPLFAPDNLTIESFCVQSDMLQILFTADAAMSPVILSQHVKGRLQHALRQRDCTVAFSRKVAVRSIGHNVRATVAQYLQCQVARGDFADPRFAVKMQRYTVSVPTVDLTQPAETAHGRYWYNVHVVLVVSGRHRFVEDRDLACLRDGVLALGETMACRVAMVSVMPDHLHCAVRGNPQRSPTNIGCAFQNGIAERMRAGRIWEDRFYVGTFSEYDLGAIARKH